MTIVVSVRHPLMRLRARRDESGRVERKANGELWWDLNCAACQPGTTRSTCHLNWRYTLAVAHGHVASRHPRGCPSCLACSGRPTDTHAHLASEAAA